ncbi:uncharacterized protein [Euphorbia lathyris]|uniref:uncharacterized protein n=1 Tax=Euphorbia lathyris TaxID=212925 RepID=UPI0033131915
MDVDNMHNGEECTGDFQSTQENFAGNASTCCSPSVGNQNIDEISKKIFDSLDTAAKDAISDDALCLMRYDALTFICKRMCQLACKSTTRFNEVMSEVTKMIRRLEEENHLRMPSGQFEGVHDPKRVRTKSRQAKKCGTCRIPGHTKTTCPLRIGFDRSVVASKYESDNDVSIDGYALKRGCKDDFISKYDVNLWEYSVSI